MNKKLTVKNQFDQNVYCVLSDTQPYAQQLSEVLSVHPGRGFTVEFDEKTVKLVDYFAGETVATFEVLSFVDTDEDVFFYWKTC